MEIHELNTKGITSPAYVALDDGADTYKLDLYSKFSAINTEFTLLELADENTAHIWYGYTTTASGTATKAVSLQFGGTFAPKTGDYIVVAFSNANTASTMSLAVASGDAVSVIFTGSTGADIPKGYHIFHITVSNGAPYQYHYVGIHATATNTIRGLMSAADKAALDTAVSDISDLNNAINQLSGLSEEVKLALLQIASKVAYIDDDGQDYYDALYNALYPPAELVSISAVYTQSGTVYTTDSLDSLKTDLVVTATYDDTTTETLADSAYTLSGTLTEGTSTITVSYGGKTTTFNVTVTHFEPITVTVTWSGTGVDSISQILDCTQYDAYYSIPFVADDTNLVEGATSSTQTFKQKTILYSDAEGTTFAGCYYIDTGEIEQTGRTTSNSPWMNFDQSVKIAPRGYYAVIYMMKSGSAAFSSNANSRAYLNANATTVTLQ